VTEPGIGRIVVTGSECTGKTTLAAALAEHYALTWLREQSRVYAETVARPLTAFDVEPIARAQLAAEDEAMAAATAAGDRWIVLDTDLVSTVVYARHYYGGCPPWIVDEARARLAQRYLLCGIDVPWRPDSVRDRPVAREEMHESFRRSFDEFGVRPCAVRGLGPQRLAAALKCVTGTAQGHLDVG